MLILGGLMRSAQFGFNAAALKLIREQQGGPTKQEDRWFRGMLDPQVILAGFAGGIGRGQQSIQYILCIYSCFRLNKSTSCLK